MKDLGFLKHILGIQVNISANGISISQSTYINTLIEEMQMVDANSAVVLAVRGANLDSEWLNGNLTAEQLAAYEPANQ